MSLPSLSDRPWLHGEALQRVLAAVTADGGEAMIAGGAVRNALLDRPVTDIDIATDEPPERVMALAERAGLHVHPIGIEHGTVLVTVPHAAAPNAFEVTTLRVDVETHGRRATVAFTTDWAADAARRDFTMNALYCGAEGMLFDPLDGYGDLVRRRVRFVGEPGERIREDYLRILRFFRFFAAYDEGKPDVRSLRACIELQAGLDRLSRERIRIELLKTLCARRCVDATRLMAEDGILARLVPGQADIARFDRLVAIERAQDWPADPVRRLAALAPGATAEELRQALRLTNAEASRIAAMKMHPHLTPRLRDPERRALLYRAGAEAYADTVLLNWAASAAAAGDPEWRRLADLANGWQPPAFPVSGADLKRHGIEPGPQMGDLLRRLEDWWIAAGFPDDKALLLRQLDKMGR